MKTQKDSKVNTFNAKYSEDPKVESWLVNSVKPNTASVYIRNFDGWYAWLKEDGHPDLRDLSPEELIDKQKELSRDYYLDKISKLDRKLILFDVIRYTEEKGETWTTSYKIKIFSSVRSFFLCHLEPHEIPGLSNGERGRLKGRKGTKKELTIEILRDIIDACNPMYRAVFSCMLAGGMGPGEIEKWSNAGIDELKEAMAEPIRHDNSEIIEIYLGARKNNARANEDFYTYIGGSALDNLKAWLKHRDDIERRFHSQGKQLPHAIFINNQYKPLTVKAAQWYYTSQIHRLKIKRKVENGSTATRYSINMDQIRTVFRSRTEKSDAKKAVLEYFMGHISDKLGYNQTHNDREYRISEYFKAVSWVDIKKIDIERQSQDYETQKHKLEEQKEAISKLEAQVADLKNMVVKEIIQPQAQTIEKFKHAIALGLEAESIRKRITNYEIMRAENDGDFEKVARLKRELAVLSPDNPESA